MAQFPSSEASSPWQAPFDPFTIGPDHINHAESTSIIKLDESGRVFCPLCLENVGLKELEKSGDRLYDQFTINLIEILDQHSQQVPLRRVVLQIIEIVLSKRCCVLNHETELHNTLRVLWKLMKSINFEDVDLLFIVKVFAIVLSNFKREPIPLSAIWKTTRLMLKCSETRLNSIPVESSKILDQNTCIFLKSIAKIIKSYLSLLNRFGFHKTCDRTFVLFEEDYTRPRYHGEKPYTDSQLDCIDFMSHTFLSKFWSFLKSMNRELVLLERTVVEETFAALNECLIASVKREYSKFPKFLCEKDCLLVAHSIIYRNSDRVFRQSLKEFINTFVKYYIVFYFDTDPVFEEFMKSEDIVETNHKNAIANSSVPERCKKTTYYIILNCIAIMLKSRYFVIPRVRRVIKSVDPQSLKLKESKVLMRAYLYTAAHVSTRVKQFDNVSGFIHDVWKSICRTSFNEQFCFHEKVLYWVYEERSFIKLFTSQSISYILKWASVRDLVPEIMKNLLQFRHFKNAITLYFKKEDSAMKVIEDIVKYDSHVTPTSISSIDDHTELVKSLSHITVSLLHSSILQSINSKEVTKDRAVNRSINLINLMMKGCEHFQIILDDQYLIDLFKFLEQRYVSANTEFEDTLISLNQFLAHMMINNSPYLMQILKHLNYNVLGYMYHRLADYTRGDYLAESIASLLITYDRIDYPLVYDLGASLKAMALSVVNWMLSRNDDLHILSLIIAKNVLNTDIEDSIRACVTTGIIHMLYDNSKILHNKVHMKYLMSIVDTETFRFNPLLNHALRTLPRELREEVINKLNRDANRDLLISPPPLTFSSGSSIFKEQQCTISQIINQLTVEEERVNSSRIPAPLYIGQDIELHSKRDNTQNWIDKTYALKQQSASAF